MFGNRWARCRRGNGLACGMLIYINQRPAAFDTGKLTNFQLNSKPFSQRTPNRAPGCVCAGSTFGILITYIRPEIRVVEYLDIPFRYF